MSYRVPGLRRRPAKRGAICGDCTRSLPAVAYWLAGKPAMRPVCFGCALKRLGLTPELARASKKARRILAPPDDPPPITTAATARNAPHRCLWCRRPCEKEYLGLCDHCQAWYEERIAKVPAFGDE